MLLLEAVWSSVVTDATETRFNTQCLALVYLFTALRCCCCWKVVSRDRAMSLSSPALSSPGLQSDLLLLIFVYGEYFNHLLEMDVAETPELLLVNVL